MRIEFWSWLQDLWSWYSKPEKATVFYPHASLINPVVGAAGAGLLILAALLQASTARKRHFEQTKADLKRRVTENFSKAVDQLGSDKIEVRLGGIYALERISSETTDDYRMVMEIVTAFIRENARWTGRYPPGGEAAGSTELTLREAPRADVVAALGLIGRRLESFRRHEVKQGFPINLSYTDLRLLALQGLDLKGANFSFANLADAALRKTDLTDATMTSAELNNADLTEAKLAEAMLVNAKLNGSSLKSAYLVGAKLRGACLQNANLDSAFLYCADLSRASLQGASLKGADLRSCNLEETNLAGARLLGAALTNATAYRADFTNAELTNAYLGRVDFREAIGITTEMLAGAKGDLSTLLPDGIVAPPNWQYRHRNV